MVVPGAVLGSRGRGRRGLGNLRLTGGGGGSSGSGGLGGGEWGEHLEGFGCGGLFRDALKSLDPVLLLGWKL